MHILILFQQLVGVYDVSRIVPFVVGMFYVVKCFINPGPAETRYALPLQTV